MTSLSERAAQAASPGPAPEPAQYAPPAPAPEPATDLDLGDYELGDDDPPAIPVHLAWLAVRRDVRAIGKNQKYIEEYGRNQKVKYHFRGVDQVVQAFGPVTLKHGVSVLPVAVDASYRDTQSKGGSKMRECTVTVTWQIIGPLGDSLPLLQTQGESLDTGDKGTAKAQSLALRTLLLNGGLIPTGDPEPEAQHIERGEAPVRSAESYRDEILDPKTSPGRLAQIRTELESLNLLTSRVQNETGELETLDAIGGRMYQERTAGGSS